MVSRYKSIKAIMNKTILLILLSLACHSCHIESDNYKNLKITDRSGFPLDSSTLYFPDSIKVHGVKTATGLENSSVFWYSLLLYDVQEPLLYNSYLGHEIYRFTWIPSFDLPVVISIQKENENIWLTSKKFSPKRIIPGLVEAEPKKVRFLPNGAEIIMRSLSKKDILEDLKKQPVVDIRKTQKLSMVEWNEFQRLLSKCNFWELSNTTDSMGLDGAEWIIESHQATKYWFVERWSPSNDFKLCGEYLIKLSGLNEKIY